jgi:hypothetical protein
LKILTKTKIDAVTDFRTDWYDTPEGPRQMSCACTWAGQLCLYHWYFTVKGGEAPSRGYGHGPAEKAKPKRSARPEGVSERPKTPRKSPKKRSRNT